MFEFLRYDARKRIRGSLTLTAGMTALAALVLWVYPSFRTSFDADELLSAYPEPLLRLFDIRTMTSLEGFLAFELYVFGWVLLLGLYLAYSAAGIIADDVDHRRMDALLAMPVSRPRLLAERFAALGVPIGLVNLWFPVVILSGAWAIGESLSPADVIAVHVLAIPYLFACASVGILCSVLVNRASIAQRLALGLTFGLYLLESLLEGTDYAILGVIAPMRYYDPNSILLEGSYDLLGAVILIGMTVVLVGLSQLWFTRKDL